MSSCLPARVSGWLETEVVKGLKRKLFRKKFLVSAVSVILTIAVLSGICSYMALTKTCVAYDSGKVQIQEEDGALYVVYQGDDLGGTVGFDPVEVTIDGKEQNVFTFYCYTTLWSEYIEPILMARLRRLRKGSCMWGRRMR